MINSKSMSDQKEDRIMYKDPNFEINKYVKIFQRKKIYYNNLEYLK